MKEPQTKIVYKGITYPFYKTNRGQFDFENAGFTNEDAAKGKTAALLALVFFTMRDCAKRAGTPITESFEQFIDDSEPDIISVFTRLAEARKTNEKELKDSKNLKG